MKLLDSTLASPEANLACDEALLDFVEEGYTHEILRFWESQQYFVVLGTSNKLHQEVYVEKCEEDGIPILRRHSGGGTVLQGPGCLNFSLILHINPEGPTRNIAETTNYIMRRHAETLTALLEEKVEVKGSSDLTIADAKFSGNAQRRRLKALLFHGTILLDFDLTLMEKYLRLPPKQPEYRQHRPHRMFVRTIAASRSLLKVELQRAWNVQETLELPPSSRIQQLVVEKYSRPDWNFKM